MSHKSPLFVSALELIVHAIELYAQAMPRKYKFVILHLANAVELILKDRLLLAGVSIYKQDGRETINVWKAFEELEELNIEIIERPIMELLIDDRNTIQHRFGFPDSSTVYYYLEHVIAFFKRFLDEEYNVDLVTELRFYLSEENRELLELIVEKDQAAYLPRLFQVSPESAAAKLRDAIWEEVAKIIEPVAINHHVSVPGALRVLKHLKEEKWLSKDTRDGILLLRSGTSPEQFEDGMVLLRELRQVRQAAYIPEIEGITKPRSNTNESRDSNEANL